MLLRFVLYQLYSGCAHSSSGSCRVEHPTWSGPWAASVQRLGRDLRVWKHKHVAGRQTNQGKGTENVKLIEFSAVSCLCSSQYTYIPGT